MADFQEETGNIYNLEATPAEGTSYRLARIDKAQYPDIRTYNQDIYSNNGGRDVEPYYTNVLFYIFSLVKKNPRPLLLKSL